MRVIPLEALTTWARREVYRRIEDELVGAA